VSDVKGKLRDVVVNFDVYNVTLGVTIRTLATRLVASVRIVTPLNQDFTR